MLPLLMLLVTIARSDTGGGGGGGGDTGSEPHDTSGDPGDDSGDDTADDTGECADGEVSVSVEAGGSPSLPNVSLMGTGVSMTASWSLSSEASVSGDECSVTLDASGEFEICGNVLGQSTCVSGDGSATPACTTPTNCDDGQVTCDFGDVCCEGPAQLSISASREWPLAGNPIGPITIEGTVSGDVSVAYEGNGAYGDGCDCPGFSLDGKISATLSARGTGTAKASLFGIEAATAEASIEACATVEQEGSVGCDGGGSSDPETGVGLVVHAEAQAMGWLKLGSYDKTYADGVECLSGGADE